MSSTLHPNHGAGGVVNKIFHLSSLLAPLYRDNQMQIPEYSTTSSSPSPSPSSSPSPSLSFSFSPCCVISLSPHISSFPFLDYLLSMSVKRIPSHRILCIKIFAWDFPSFQQIVRERILVGSGKGNSSASPVNYTIIPTFIMKENQHLQCDIDNVNIHYDQKSLPNVNSMESIWDFIGKHSIPSASSPSPSPSPPSSLSTLLLHVGLSSLLFSLWSISNPSPSLSFTKFLSQLITKTKFTMQNNAKNRANTASSPSPSSSSNAVRVNENVMLFVHIDSFIASHIATELTSSSSAPSSSSSSSSSSLSPLPSVTQYSFPDLLRIFPSMVFLSPSALSSSSSSSPSSSSSFYSHFVNWSVNVEIQNSYRRRKHFDGQVEIKMEIKNTKILTTNTTANQSKSMARTWKVIEFEVGGKGRNNEIDVDVSGSTDPNDKLLKSLNDSDSHEEQNQKRKEKLKSEREKGIPLAFAVKEAIETNSTTATTASSSSSSSAPSYSSFPLSGISFSSRQEIALTESYSINNLTDSDEDDEGDNPDDDLDI